MMYLLNEVEPGSDPTKGGAIYVFPSKEAVTSYFEPWYVDETYLLIGSDGRRWSLVGGTGGLAMAPHADRSDYKTLLTELLINHLRGLETTLKDKKALSEIGRISFEKLDIDSMLRLAVLIG